MQEPAGASGICPILSVLIATRVLEPSRLGQTEQAKHKVTHDNDTRHVPKNEINRQSFICFSSSA
jgi:hypothetical protein